MDDAPNYRADRKGIQPRTIKGMSDEQWGIITGAAERDGLTVARWVYRAAMAYLSGQAGNPAPVIPPVRPADLDIEPLRLEAPRQHDRMTMLERAAVLEKLAVVAATTAPLENGSAWRSLGRLVRENIRAMRSDLVG